MIRESDGCRGVLLRGNLDHESINTRDSFLGSSLITGNTLVISFDSRAELERSERPAIIIRYQVILIGFAMETCVKKFATVREEIHAAR